MRRTVSRTLLAAAVAGALVVTGTAGTAAAASKCTRAESLVRISKKQLKRDKNALRVATTRLRRHPGSVSAKRALARAKLRVHADNRALNRHKQSFEQACLPGY